MARKIVETIKHQDGAVSQRTEYFTEYEFRRLKKLGVLRREYSDGKKCYERYFRTIRYVKNMGQEQLIVII